MTNRAAFGHGQATLEILRPFGCALLLQEPALAEKLRRFNNRLSCHLRRNYNFAVPVDVGMFSPTSFVEFLRGFLGLLLTLESL